MKESLRRPVLFAVIVITGSVLILFDIPLILMIPILLVVGFLILLIVGAVTAAEIKTALESLKPANLKKIGFIKKLDEMKFFEKSASIPKDKGQPVKSAGKQPAKGSEPKSGIGLHLTSFVSSIKSLGTLIRERNKRGKKIEEINKQLDRTVTEKVEKRSALESAGNVTDTSVPLPARGAGTSSQGTSKDQDPFLSLSDDEFDAGLLDSLDDMDSPISMAAGAGDSPSLQDSTSLEINEPDIPLPSLDLDGEAGNILRDNAQGLEEFSGLDGGDTIDSDFGDLDSLSLDDVELEDDDGNPAAPQAPAAPAPIQDVAPPEPAKDQVQTGWIKSDAPKNAGFEDQISTQSDMASFSAGTMGSDADMLSSLASDVKHVKVEKNLSLLRELTDFKAPAAEIESELNDMYTRMDSIKKTQKKETSPPEGTN